MTYEITDEFLDKVDVLLDSVMEMAQHTDLMTASGVALVDLKRLEAVCDNAARVCDAMEDGFPEYGNGKDEEDEEDEEDTEECADPGDNDPVAVFDAADGFGCDPDAD